MKKEITIGFQDCSKCEYKINCNECIYNQKGIERIIEDTRKATTREIFAFIDKMMDAFCNDSMDIEIKHCEYKASTRNFVRETYGIELDENTISGCDIAINTDYAKAVETPFREFVEKCRKGDLFYGRKNNID